MIPRKVWLLGVVFAGALTPASQGVDPSALHGVWSQAFLTLPGAPSALVATSYDNEWERRLLAIEEAVREREALVLDYTMTGSITGPE